MCHKFAATGISYKMKAEPGTVYILLVLVNPTINAGNHGKNSSAIDGRGDANKI